MVNDCLFGRSWAMEASAAVLLVFDQLLSPSLVVPS